MLCFVVLETGSQFVGLAGLELAKSIRLASNAATEKQRCRKKPGAKKDSVMRRTEHAPIRQKNKGLSLGQ